MKLKNKFIAVASLFSLLIANTPVKAITDGSTYADTAWEIRTAGAEDHGGCFWWDVLTDTSTYQWTESTSTSGEYYLEASGGGDPAITEPTSVYLDGNYNLATNGTVGSLNVSEWDWGDNDTLGYSTLYVRLSDTTDPDSKYDSHYKYIGMGHDGGTDYSQQNESHETYTDLVVDATVNTKITSSAKPFNSDDQGNCINITSGGSWTNGWYVITDVDGSNIATLDRSPAATSTGSGAGTLGGAIASPWNIAGWGPADGNSIYVLSDGTYTAASNYDERSNDGASALRILLEGYNATRGEDLTGSVADMPNISMGGFYLLIGESYIISQLDISTTGAISLNPQGGSWMRKINCVNTSGTSGRPCLNPYFGQRNSISHSAAKSENGKAIAMSSNYGHIVHKNIVYDSNVGIEADLDTAISNSIVDSCNTGIDIIDIDVSVAGTLLYGNTIGIDINANDAKIFDNNFVGNETAIDGSDADSTGAFLDYNNYSNNTTDLDGSMYRKGNNATSTDPSFTDAPGQDFTPGSGFKDSGQYGWLGIYTSYGEIGPTDREEPAAGGGGASSYTYVQ